MHVRTARPALLTLLSVTLIAPAALAQPTDSAPTQPAPKKEPVKKQELPKPPIPKPASEITLKVGDKAPLFKPDVWIKTIPALPLAAPSASPATPNSTPAAPPTSTPTDTPGPATLTFDPSKIYIVEFWATWCQSCREAMPALAKLQRANKDLVIVSVCSSERKPAKDAADERLEGVRRFVTARPESFPYAVVFDGSRSIANNWIAAAGKVYLPTSFVIDNTGTITWIGDPRESGFETAVTRALKTLPQPKPPEPVTPDPKKKPAKPRSKP